MSSVNHVCLKEAKTTKRKLQFVSSGVIACKPTDGREVSVSNWEFPAVQMQKVMCSGGACPVHTIHILIGGRVWEKDTEVPSVPERLTSSLLGSWLHPWIIQQGANTTVSTSKFYSCFYLSAREAAHVIGSLGKTGGEHSIGTGLAGCLILLCQGASWVSVKLIVSFNYSTQKWLTQNSCVPSWEI